MDTGLSVFVGWLVVCAALVAYRLAQRFIVLAGARRRRLDTAPNASEGR